MTQHKESRLQEAIANGAADEAALETIRDLLLAPEQEALSNLQTEIEQSRFSAERLSRMLPKSIEKARDQGDDLSQSLGPVIDGAITESIKRDPETLADAISPIMMPAIRRSIYQMIASMAQSFNRTLEQSLSAQGVKWRFEAIRTGRKFSEVVMLHSLKYRVEQVFLIHRETGLMLAHVADTEAGVIDADMVSGMLTAIQDFVRDSFSAGKRQLLNTMDCEDHDVFIEYGPKAILAAVVSGIAPPDLRTRIAETLENIHIEHAALLSEYVGDSGPFEMTHPELKQCLISELKSADRQERGVIAKYAWVIPVAVLVYLLIWGGLRWHDGNRIQAFAEATRMPTTVSASYNSGTIRLNGEAHDDWLRDLPEQASRLDWLTDVEFSEVQNLDEKWIRFVDQLCREPGIVITESKRIDNTYQLAGLRDPRAAQPDELLANSGVSPDSVRMNWKPYHSLDQPSDDKWIAFLDKLRREPGIVITESTLIDTTYQLAGLRDPLAAEPSELLANSGLQLESVRMIWKPYHSYDQPILERRIAQMLDPPESVSLRWQNDRLIITGSATDTWWRTAQQRVLAALGPERVEYAMLKIANSNLNTYIDLLSKEPGIDVTSTEWHDGRFRVQGKRDEYAADPDDLRWQSGLSNFEVQSQWSQFVSHDPIIVERRVRDLLKLPTTVSVHVVNKQVHLGGTAKIDWIANLAERIEQSNVVYEIDYRDLSPDYNEELSAVKKAISEVVLLFKTNSSEISDGQRVKIQQVASQIVKLKGVAENTKWGFRVKIAGRTATQKPQKALSLERVQAVLQILLLNPELAPEMFESSWSEGDLSPWPDIDQNQRGRVTFEVIDSTNQ